MGFNLWSQRSNLSPHFCKKCEDFSKEHIGGADVCMTMLFADIRGSTKLGESMKPSEFRELLNKFYTAANNVLTENGAWIDKFVGDEVIGLFIPGFADQICYRTVRSYRSCLSRRSMGSPGYRN